jgi:hypothetical protein
MAIIRHLSDVYTCATDLSNSFVFAQTVVIDTHKKKLNNSHNYFSLNEDIKNTEINQMVRYELMLNNIQSPEDFMTFSAPIVFK